MLGFMLRFLAKPRHQDPGDLVLWLNVHTCPKGDLLFCKKQSSSVFATCNEAANLNGRARPMFVFSLTFGFNHFNFPKRKRKPLLNFGTYHFTISPFHHFVISPIRVLNTPAPIHCLSATCYYQWIWTRIYDARLLLLKEHLVFFLNLLLVHLLQPWSEGKSVTSLCHIANRHDQRPIAMQFETAFST